MPENVASAAASIIVLLQLIFVALKIFSVIAWDWIWVLAPMWVPAAFIVIVVIIAIVTILF